MSTDHFATYLIILTSLAAAIIIPVFCILKAIARNPKRPKCEHMIEPSKIYSGQKIGTVNCLICGAELVFEIILYRIDGK